MYTDNKVSLYYKGDYFLLNLKKGIKVGDCILNLEKALHAAAKKDKKAEVLFNVENLVVLTKTDLEVLIQTYAKTIKSEITFSIVNTKYPAVRQQIEAINEKIRQHKKTHHPTITMYNTLEEYVEEKGYKPTQPLMDLNLDPEIEKLLR